ncbi:hypothetical protein B0H11DRAFT_2231268 [Mycena galericulata]|nr:hypothetical protein B0H11DRAFT_2231268 [Mycena galericulata]
MSESSRTHKLRRGTVIYATGFILTHSQMQAISRSVCDDAFLSRYGHDLILALKWRANKSKYQILPINDDAHARHLFAIKFFPYLQKDVPATASNMFTRLCSLSDEQKNTWHETFGKHTGMQLQDYEQMTIPYPTDGAGTGELLAATPAKGANGKYCAVDYYFGAPYVMELGATDDIVAAAFTAALSEDHFKKLKRMFSLLLFKLHSSVLVYLLSLQSPSSSPAQSDFTFPTEFRRAEDILVETKTQYAVQASRSAATPPCLVPFDHYAAPNIFGL